MKKAVCVGINDYPFEDNDLKGCVNDAKAWQELLVARYGFAREDVTLLLDKDATKANILGSLEKMVAEAKPGDVLVFTNSSHGTYLVDTDADEEEYDEALVPYDGEQNLIVDDELRELFAKLADGVSMTAILDSCFSGTATRAPVFPKTPDDLRDRFLNPRLLGRPTLANIEDARPRQNTKYPESAMKDVLISGCTDKQQSGDARIDGAYHGVMTYYALQAIQDGGFRITFDELATRLHDLLKSSHYEQSPQVEGSAANKARYIFAEAESAAAV